MKRGRSEGWRWEGECGQVRVLGRPGAESIIKVRTPRHQHESVRRKHSRRTFLCCGREIARERNPDVRV